jgi:hypothetical protein
MKKRSKSIAICLTLALCACSNKDNPMPTQVEWSAVGAKPAFLKHGQGRANASNQDGVGPTKSAGDPLSSEHCPAQGHH